MEHDFLEEGTVIVHGRSEGFAQQIAVGRHRLTSDEPASSGGTDTGPDPYGFLLAALGSCMSITVTMYARRKQWPLDGITVRLRHSKIHSSDCERCETADDLLDRIECDVEFTGVLTGAQRIRLLEIANRCPVHRTLTSEVEIRSGLA